jgi:hypothetical protein
MPAPAWPWRIRLKKDALATAAEVIGPIAYRKDGQPDRAILLGEGSRDDVSRLINDKHNASVGSFATAAMRLKEASGIEDPWDAAKLLFEFVETDPAPSRAAT